MAYINKSVGKGGGNDMHDVAAIQVALRVAKVPSQATPRMFYSGKVDGKNSSNLIDGITDLQNAMGIEVTGRIEPYGKTIMALKRQMNANWVNCRGLRDTAQVFVPGKTLEFDPIKQTRNKSPFPMREAEGLASVMNRLQKENFLSLTRKRDFISSDGRFGTELQTIHDQWVDTTNVSLYPIGTIPTQAIKAIHKMMVSEGSWQGSLEPRPVNCKQFWGKQRR